MERHTAVNTAALGLNDGGAEEGQEQCFLMKFTTLRVVLHAFPFSCKCCLSLPVCSIEAQSTILASQVQHGRECYIKINVNEIPSKPPKIEL
jgi:hypothetical protein